MGSHKPVDATPDGLEVCATLAKPDATLQIAMVRGSSPSQDHYFLLMNFSIKDFKRSQESPENFCKVRTWKLFATINKFQLDFDFFLRY